MREDVEKIITARLSWKYFQDHQLQDLAEAKSIATKDRDYETVAVIDEMIKTRKDEIAGGQL